MPDEISPIDAWATWLAPNREWEERKRRFWALTPDQRVQAMRAGQLPLRLCLHWANHAPHEVPILNGEWEFIAVHTPEIADAHDTRIVRNGHGGKVRARCPENS
jgi:hypothetical protein